MNAIIKKLIEFYWKCPEVAILIVGVLIGLLIGWIF
jgi:hypothetical protein